MNNHRSISELTLKNFKPFSERLQRMPIKPLTLLYGPNSSGKSSLLQVIALAHEATINESGTIDAHVTQLAGDSIDLGGFRKYVHRREITRDVNLGFKLDIEEIGSIFIEFIFGALPDIVSHRANGPIHTKQFSVRHNDEAILSLKFDQYGIGALEEFDQKHPLFLGGTPHLYHIEIRRGKLFPDLDPGVPVEAKISLSDSCQRFIDHIKIQFCETLNSMLYLGSSHYIPSLDFSEGSEQNPNQLSGIARAWDHICKNRELRDTINQWLQANDRLKIPYRIAANEFGDKCGNRSADPQFNSTRLDRLRLVDLRSETTVSRKNVGGGVSQVLPVLATALGPTGCLIAIEKPELHLHPAIQAELADVFLSSAIERNNTVIVETHSELIILRILRRIRESSESNSEFLPQLKVRPEQVCLLYVQPSDFGSQVLEIPLTSDGEFGASWPDGFFPDQRKELF